MPTIEDAKHWYREDDPVHGFDHILRVRALALHLATKYQADSRIVEAAALLHDASGGDGLQGERSSHHEASGSFARDVLAKEGWNDQDIEHVVECIAAHRYRGGDQAKSLEAKVLYDADKLDVVGAFGAVRTVAYAVEAEQPIFAQPSKKFIESGEGEKEEPHSAYHEYIFKLRKVRKSLNLDESQRLALEREKVLINLFEGLRQEAEFAAKVIPPKDKS